MTELRQKMMQDMALAGYRAKTQKTYLESIRSLAKFYHRSRERLTQHEIRGWVRHLIDQCLSSQRLRQHFAALKCLYGKTLARPQDVAFLSWPRDIEKLPEILSADEVVRLLGALTTPRTAFSTPRSTRRASGSARRCCSRRATSTRPAASYRSVTARAANSGSSC